MKYIYILVAVVVVGCSTSLIQKDNRNSREFEFTYNVDLESTDGKKVELWIPIPQSNAVQTISNLKLDAGGLNYQIKDEIKHGNKYYYIYSEDGIEEDKIVKMTFNVKRHEHSNVEYNNVNNDIYLKASSLVPVGDFFKEIINLNKLDNKNIRNTYDFVLNGMHYGKPTDDKNSKNYKYIHGGKNPKTDEEWLSDEITYGTKKKTKNQLVESQNHNEKYAFGNGNSLYACDIGVGNCTDYHSYFISLNRTLGVPARFHMGFPIPAGSEGKVGGYHCWADYYVEGKGWFPVDISEADKDPSKVEYFFGKVDENRVEMMIGRDFELFGYESGIANLFIYPILEVNDKESKGFKKNFTYKNI